jgi:hypothetical protein
MPADPHHLRFAQPRALGRKVSDEFTVPLCRLHHSELHRYGDEVSWWAGVNVDPCQSRSRFGAARVGTGPRHPTPKVSQGAQVERLALS